MIITEDIIKKTVLYLDAPSNRIPEPLKNDEIRS